MGKESSPPPAPDYRGAAEATAQGNLANAELATKANRYNQFTPYGSQTWTQGTQPGEWSSSINLSPVGQSLFDQYNQTSQGLAGMTGGALGRVGDVQSQGFNLSGVPGSVSNVGMGQPGAMPDAHLNLGNLPQIGEEARNAAETAAYGRATSRLDPQWNDRQTEQETQLRNQGLVPGGEAYDKAARNMTFARNDAYDQARRGAVGEGLNAQQQQYAQAITNWNADTAAKQNEYARAFGAQGAAFGQQNQMFNQGLANANLANSTRGQSIQEQAFLRGLPLNELNALRTGSQVNMPTFQAGGMMQAVPGANYSGAAGQTGTWDQNLYNQQVGQGNAFMGGLAGLGAGALGAPSGSFANMGLKAMFGMG